MGKEYILCLLVDGDGVVRRFHVKQAESDERVIHCRILGHYDNESSSDDAIREFHWVTFRSEAELKAAGYGWTQDLPSNHPDRSCYLIRPQYFRTQFSR